VVQAVALLLAFASYWAPWVAHAAAGLTIAEVDFVEFPKFMPQVRAAELSIWREAFYMPLLVLAVALVVMVSRPGSARPAPAGRPFWQMDLRRWLVRMCALALPLSPSVFNVFEPGEFQTQLKLEAIVLASIVLAPLLRRLPARLVQGTLILWFLFGALAPSLQFFQLKPALEAIYNQPISVGWGLWAALLGFGLLAMCELFFAMREKR
jgi:hypothetical protein